MSGQQQSTTSGGQQTTADKIKFEGEFDFEQANARFEEEVEKQFADKLKLGEQTTTVQQQPEPTQQSQVTPPTTTVPEDAKLLQLNGANASDPLTDSNNNIDNKIFYDKNLSFFDSISCEANEKNSKAKNWKEERKLNVETFGFSNNRNNNSNNAYKRSNYNNYNSYSNSNYGNNMQRPQSYSNQRSSGGRGYSNGYGSQQQDRDTRSTRAQVDTGYGNGRNSGNRRYGSTR